MGVKECLLPAVLVMTVLSKTASSQEDIAVDLREDGGYGFRYQNADEGGHYGEAVATPDNTVSGKFGYREPGTGRNLETQYTSGARGFRARGPSVHRRMDLSQVKIPYNPPVSPDSPAYNPTYSTYYDPNEDSSYHFDFTTREYKRTETGGPLGQIAGAYSYVDDAGDIHNVEFEAGSQTGFHVKTPYPDSNHNYNELYFRGDGKVPLRGRTSIQQGVDGSYRFTSHSQDQRRSEVKDAQGNTRGSYTYIDKDGTQRTVQYIAGPNIGYKIINQGLGPTSEQQFPFINPNFIPPSLLGGGGISGFGSGDGSSPLFGTGGGGIGGVKPPKGLKPRPTSPTFSTTTPFGLPTSTPSSTRPPPFGGNKFGIGDSFGNGGGTSFGGGVTGSSNGQQSPFGGGAGSLNNGGSPFGNKGTPSSSSSGGGASEGFGGIGSSFSGGGSSGEGGGLFGGGGRPSTPGRPPGGLFEAGGRPSTPGRPPGGLFEGGGRPSTPGTTTTSRPNYSCCPNQGPDSQGNGSPGQGSTDGESSEPPYPPSGQKPPNGLREPLFSSTGKKPPLANGKPKKPTPSVVDDFLSPTIGYPPPPHAGFPEEGQPKPFESPSFKPFTGEDNLFLQRPFSSLPPKTTGTKFYPDDFRKESSFVGRSDFSDEFQDKDGAFSEKEFRGFPPGVSVRGRIQSLDIYRYGTKVPPPGEALEYHGRLQRRS